MLREQKGKKVELERLRKTLEVLDLAQKKIRSAKNWRQWALAADKQGRPCGPKAKCAVCWCASGAVYAVGSTKQQAKLALVQLAEAIGAGVTGDWTEADIVDMVVDYNDNRGHKDVLRVFTKAKTRTRKQIKKLQADLAKGSL